MHSLLQHRPLALSRPVLPALRSKSKDPSAPPTLQRTAGRKSLGRFCLRHLRPPHQPAIQPQTLVLAPAPRSHSILPCDRLASMTCQPTSPTVISLRAQSPSRYLIGRPRPAYATACKGQERQPLTFGRTMLLYWGCFDVCHEPEFSQSLTTLLWCIKTGPEQSPSPLFPRSCTRRSIL